MGRGCCRSLGAPCRDATRPVQKCLPATGDGRVTVNELKAYLESTVPEVTAKHKGTAQYPASYGFGQDFPIALSNR